ncbi:MAG: hypothetical protein ACLFWF_14105 [Alphaproteobacteria bacterium]
MTVRFWIVPVLLALAGCVSVDTQQIDDRVLRVSVRSSSALIDAATVQDQALYSAADETLKRGFRYFAIFNSRDASRRGVFSTPGSASTTGTFDGDSFSAQTYYTPPQYYGFVKPGQDIWIRMFRADELTEEQRMQVFDARQVVRHLGPKYGEKNK